MSNNLDKYLPEFDEDDLRSRLAGFTAEELTDMLVYAYKEKRVFAKILDEKLKSSAGLKRLSLSPQTSSERLAFLPPKIFAA